MARAAHVHWDGGTEGCPLRRLIEAGILPATAEINHLGHLKIGGCDTMDLAARFGTPLIVYDEEHLRRRCRQALAAYPVE